MIGRRPYVLTAIAALLLGVVVLDDIGRLTRPSGGSRVARPAVHAADDSGAAHWVNHALGAVARALGHLSLVDLVLIVCAVLLIAWGWVRAVAFARLGSIEIANLEADDEKLGPLSVRAALQNQLGDRGLLPASGVPGGSPSVGSLAAAVADVPIDQFSWVAGLIAMIPFPPTSTRFRISGTLTAGATGPHAGDVGLTYQLACLGPRRAVKLGELWAADWTDLVDVAAKDMYRKIADQAPEIYPAWARWANSPALTVYRRAIELERTVAPVDQAVRLRSVTERYEAAHAGYCAASELDPDNMLVRLRAANCLERIAANVDDADERVTSQVAALQAYVAVRLRQPTIFQAGFRASVLLSSLAQAVPELDHSAQELAKLRVVLRRLTEAHAATPGGLVARLRRRRVRGFGPPPVTAADQLGLELDAVARHESRLARRQLRPLWTISTERRFRHRYEPRGSERRQLRKAMGISQICLRARRAALGRGSVSDLTQYLWRGWVFWRYFAGRSRAAGWQAHYNAACFYAMLPQADEPSRTRGERVRRRALHHLASATRSSGRELSCVYVRDEDPDLEVLRRRSRNEFEFVLRPICADEVIVHYTRPPTEPAWGLHVWGAATAPSTRREWGDPLKPSARTDAETIYRIRVFDENRPLEFLAYSPVERDDPGWKLTPAEHGSNVWVAPGDPRIHDAPDQAAQTGAAGDGVSGAA
jgi:hypothetical protein